MASESSGGWPPKAPLYKDLPTARSRGVRGGSELVEIRVRLEVVTPILGGSHQTRDIDDVDVIRAPSVRGHLRFCWRALYASQCSSSDELYKRESAYNSEIRLYPGQGQPATTKAPADANLPPKGGVE